MYFGKSLGSIFLIVHPFICCGGCQIPVVIVLPPQCKLFFMLKLCLGILGLLSRMSPISFYMDVLKTDFRVIFQTFHIFKVIYNNSFTMQVHFGNILVQLGYTKVQSKSQVRIERRTIHEIVCRP